MTEPQFTAAPDDDATGGANRRLLVGGGVGALVLAALGGYLLLSGGSSDSTAITVPQHITPTVAAAVSPSASPSESVLQDFHGDVDSRDPFALPPALVAAEVPVAPAAASATGGPAVAASPTVAASAAATPGAVVLPTTLSAGGTPVTVLPGTTASSPVASPGPGALPGTTASPTSTATPTTGVVPQADEFLQLLAVHHNTVTNVWTVDVRSSSGVVKGVKPKTLNVAGTLFRYDDEEDISGTPTFVFELGESKGGNLVADKHETATMVHADKSTLVLHDGTVDGGVYPE